MVVRVFRVRVHPGKEDEFTAVKMKPRFQELVGRIPADLVKGQSIQYYIEVKDATGKLIAQSGSPVAPRTARIRRTAGPTPRSPPVSPRRA